MGTGRKGEPRAGEVGRTSCGSPGCRWIYQVLRVWTGLIDLGFLILLVMAEVRVAEITRWCV